MPASPSTARGSDCAFVLRPGAPMLSASKALLSRARFLAAPPMRTFTAGGSKQFRWGRSPTRVEASERCLCCA